jgi:hypothetical protein
MAIPTVYAGVQFRSRLEARWAAFFDLLRWPWDYEPIDLEGYIPDFLIRAREPFIVEVKGRSEEISGARRKIMRSGWEGDALIVTDHLPTEGSGPPRLGAVAGGPCRLVWCVSCKNLRGDEPRPSWWEGEYVGGAALGLIECSGGNGECLLCGEKPDFPSWWGVMLWREAGNRVQWRSPRGAR